jgi:tellurite resistance protein TehA-like permease
MSAASMIWSSLFITGLVFEAYTILDRRRGTTLSAHVWRLRARAPARAVLVGAAAWIVYHFFFEDPAAAATAVDDWTIPIVGILATLVRTTPRENAR